MGRTFLRKGVSGVHTQPPTCPGYLKHMFVILSVQHSRDSRQGDARLDLHGHQGVCQLKVKCRVSHRLPLSGGGILGWRVARSLVGHSTELLAFSALVAKASKDGHYIVLGFYLHCCSLK